MRRKDREITDFNEIQKIIDACEILRLGLADGDFPYIVPVNFAYTVTDGQICFYIHGAVAGRKYELLCRNPVCSFEMDIPLWDKQASPFWRVPKKKPPLTVLLWRGVRKPRISTTTALPFPARR